MKLRRGYFGDSKAGRGLRDEVHGGKNNLGQIEERFSIHFEGKSHS